ncbi:MAG: hypothetical protein ACK4S4_12345 [Pyrinomonadaceae bacterium]
MVRLRAMLDSLEDMTLYYCLSGPTEKEKMSRAKRLEKKLGPLTREITKLAHPARRAKGPTTKLASDDPSGGQCPPGFFECNGMCVPYPCP